jgi:anti-sigma factor RsiW
MNGSRHTEPLLGGYVLGVLEPGERRAVEEHLASCPDCQLELADLAAMRAALGEVPPEAFLDGPPEGGDLLLRRTLRAVRGQRSSTDRRRYALVAAGVVALTAVALGAGVLIGNRAAPKVTAVGPTVSSAAPSALPSGTRSISTKNPATGAAMTVAITPAAGWVRLHAKVEGVAAGQRCQLVVVGRDGTRTLAGSWLVSAKGERDGTILDGTALIAPNDIASVEVQTVNGKQLVSVPA